MTDQPLVQRMRARIRGLVNHGEEICAEFVSRPHDDGGLAQLCKQCGYSGDTHTLRDALDALEASEQARQQAEQRAAIVDLSVPLEDELYGRIDEMVKHLATEQGFTLNGIARLLIECQRRMAADWAEVGSARRQVKQAEQERDAIKADAQFVFDAFARAEAQGFRSRERQFAIDILKPRLTRQGK